MANILVLILTEDVSYIIFIRSFLHSVENTLAEEHNSMINQFYSHHLQRTMAANTAPCLCWLIRNVLLNVPFCLCSQWARNHKPILILQRQIKRVKHLHYGAAVVKTEIENRSESIFKSHPYWHLTTAAWLYC